MLLTTECNTISNASFFRVTFQCTLGITKACLVSLQLPVFVQSQEVGKGPEIGSVIGRKLPTINAGLQHVSMPLGRYICNTDIFHISRFTVNEKQHRISGSFEFGSGFFREQLVRIAFWVWSKAIAPNFSQYETSDGSAIIS